MPQKTSIEWTDYSSQLIRYRNSAGRDVWACAKVSPGCAHCYSEAIARRWKRGGPFTKDEVAKVEPYFAEGEAAAILRTKALAGKRVFIGDMTDCFGEWVPDALLDRMFAAFALRPDVVFQVLTKRAERMAAYFAEDDHAQRIAHLAYELGGDCAAASGVPIVKERDEEGHADSVWAETPFDNVWLGVSVEDQQRADERIPHLLATPAAVRFLSVEPLLGEVNLDQWLPACCERGGREGQSPCPYCIEDGWKYERSGIHWVIVGGESGAGARPFHVNWARSLRDQCKTAGVAFFMKQFGSTPVVHAPPAGDMAQDQHRLLPLRLRDRKGGDMNEFPENLRIREFPNEH